MKEEKVTKVILSYLVSNKWEIVAFDFPQSGTGVMLHPDNDCSEKNKGAFIPDIVATKDGICLFFENKDRFYYSDYVKVNDLILKDIYTRAIMELIANYNVHAIRYGIGLPTKKHTLRAGKFKHLVDFVVGVNEDFSLNIIYDNYNVF